MSSRLAKNKLIHFLACKPFRLLDFLSLVASVLLLLIMALTARAFILSLWTGKPDFRPNKVTALSFNIINMLMITPMAYIVYFLLRSEDKVRQSRAVVCTILVSLAVYTNLLRCIFPTIPGGYVDMAPMVVAIFFVSLNGATIAGVANRVIRFRKVNDSVTLCSKCGYNLTGNVSGTCPECGSKYS